MTALRSATKSKEHAPAASARPSRLLPVPGGPWSSTPVDARGMPMALSACGRDSGRSTAWVTRRTASSMPARCESAASTGASQGIPTGRADSRAASQCSGAMAGFSFAVPPADAAAASASLHRRARSAPVKPRVRRVNSSSSAAASSFPPTSGSRPSKPCSITRRCAAAGVPRRTSPSSRPGCRSAGSSRPASAATPITKTRRRCSGSSSASRSAAKAPKSATCLASGRLLPTASSSSRMRRLADDGAFGVGMRKARWRARSASPRLGPKTVEPAR